MKPISILTVSSLLSLAGCIGHDYPDDSANDVEVTGGKEDGWLGASAPQGTYLAAHAGAGEFSKITIKTDRTYTRETTVECITAPCMPLVETGKYKITHGGGTDYLRFLKDNGTTLVDRYSWEIHGRQLKLRKVGADDWQELMIDDHKGSVTSAYAGIYTDYMTSTDAGFVFELQLEDTGQFYTQVHGLIGCTKAGHSCPESWSDGPLGYTNFYGTWSAQAGGVSLVPTDDNTGDTSPPIDVGLTRTGDSLAISGNIGTIQLIGPMKVRALLNGSHSVKDSNLNGTWKFTTDNRKGGFASNLEGFSEAVNGGTHSLFFDASISEAVETSQNNNVGAHRYQFQVAGDPTGGSLGVVYFKNGTEFAALPIKSKTTTKLVLRDQQDTFDFTLVKQ